MMDKKRVRDTLNSLVDFWCTEEPVYKVDVLWIRGQISFAYLIEAITLSERDELIKRVSETKGGD